MPDHPVATASQHEQELAALDLIEHPTVKGAYRTVAETWLARAKASDAMRERFDDAFAEVMFSAAVWSSNQDKLRPKVSCITRLAHPVDGRSVPGSRWGIDNPDSVYRVIPISGDERYEIRGRVGEHRIEVCTNISCWMRGGDELLDAFRAAAAGEDVFVTGFECLGACDIAPMASIDQRYFGPLLPGEAKTAIDQLLSGDAVLPDKSLEKRPLAGDTPTPGASGASGDPTDGSAL